MGGMILFFLGDGNRLTFQAGTLHLQWAACSLMMVLVPWHSSRAQGSLDAALAHQGLLRGALARQAIFSFFHENHGGADPETWDPDRNSDDLFIYRSQ